VKVSLLLKHLSQEVRAGRLWFDTDYRRPEFYKNLRPIAEVATDVKDRRSGFDELAIKLGSTLVVRCPVPKCVASSPISRIGFELLEYGSKPDRIHDSVQYRGHVIPVIGGFEMLMLNDGESSSTSVAPGEPGFALPRIDSQQR
jgi:hypothetical protein